MLWRDLNMPSLRSPNAAYTARVLYLTPREAEPRLSQGMKGDLTAKRMSYGSRRSQVLHTVS